MRRPSLLDRAHAMLTDQSRPDLTPEEIADTAAAVGRLVTAVKALIRDAEPTQSSFADFLAEHPELGWIRW